MLLEFININHELVNSHSEKGNLTDYGQTSAEEFFAEVHMYMYLEPDTIAEKCPQAYEYVQNCVAAIS